MGFRLVSSFLYATIQSECRQYTLHTCVSGSIYQINYCDEQLEIRDREGLTSYAEVTEAMKATGQALLDHYVATQGASISQMLRRSVEVKDWRGESR